MVINSSKFNLKEGVEFAVKKYLEAYHGEVIEAMTEAVPEVAKESVKKLKESSPRGKRKKYYKGWTYKVEKGRVNIGATIYGKTGTYQLAHLLEHGHAKRSGGRTDAKIHIEPVEQWANDEVINRMLEKLSK